MTLNIARAQGSDGSLGVAFDFYAVAANPNVPTGSGTLQGTYMAGYLALTWQAFTRQPAGYGGVDLKGSLSGSSAKQTLSGTVTALSGGNACTTFSLTRTSASDPSAVG